MRASHHSIGRSSLGSVAADLSSGRFVDEAEPCSPVSPIGLFVNEEEGCASCGLLSSSLTCFVNEEVSDDGAGVVSSHSPSHIASASLRISSFVFRLP